MATKDSESSPTNLMEKVLDTVREEYIEEHGEEPSEEFLQNARKKILRERAKKSRDDHREIYDALADE
ncbi:hypothetical protein [Halorussus sp. MSC15.2]|uniref:hypothetical protein n=1 Tax=Halorussus sp. MSC15.2 TaxID=2283638 RepID=UPI0013D7A92C|nr:hypothetical protein [Halorussus sp. MSC15.2]NEU58758.1 hypothetical protein [Halorussus sp. MSC15.2]